MTNPPPYDNFGINANAAEPHRLKRFAAHICGIMQLCLACIMITVGIVKDAALFPALGIHAFLGGLLTILAAAFGIQYSRTGSKCPTIASMVFSIMASVVMFSGFINNSIYVGVAEAHMDQSLRLMVNSRQISPRDSDAIDIARLTIQHAFQGAAEACFALMVFACLINFITCVVQSGLACGIVCGCCKSVTNTNAYISNPAPGYPAGGNPAGGYPVGGNPAGGFPAGGYPVQPGMNTEQQPQAGYDVNMGHINSNA